MATELRRDIVYALRTLRKNPAFTAAALLALGLGIGANTAVFSVVEAIVNFPLPVDDPSRIALVYSQNPSQGAAQNAASVPDFLDWREGSRSFERMAALRPAAYNLSGEGEPLRVSAVQVSPGFFPMLGMEPAIGRSFREEERLPGAAKPLVLSHDFWQQNFAGDAGLVGRTVLLDGVAHTIVGVAPPGFFFPDTTTALWVPLTLDPNSRRDQRDVLVMGRLAPGASFEQADAELRSIARRIEQDHPQTHQGWTVQVIGIRDDFIGDAALVLAMLYGSISFVLLIACANVANLLLARAAARQKEIALRSTLGAGRLRLFRQLLTESLVLALSGGALGLLTGWWGMKMLRGMLAPDPNIGFIAQQMEMSGAVLAHTAGISMLAGILFGLAPALQISRPNLIEALKQGGRGSGEALRRRRLRSGLVVAEVALSLALLGMSGAFIRAFSHLYSADPGFDPQQLLTMQVHLPESVYSQPSQIADFYRQALPRLERVAGAESAAAATSLPLTLFPGTLHARLSAEGQAQAEDSQAPNTVVLTVSPRYFEALKVPILQGRALSSSDSGESFAAAVISQAAALRFWPQGSPVGRRFQLGDDGRLLTVVGVAEDVQNYRHSIRYATLDVPQVFLPLQQNPPPSAFLLLKTRVDPLSLAPSARRAIWDVDPHLPVESLASMEQVYGRIDTQNTFIVFVLTGLAAVALLLAAVGIYGVISYAVQQRSQEFGIRMALGARPRDVLLLVARQGAMLAAVGLPAGLAGALAFLRLASSRLEGLSAGGATGLTTFAGVSLILLAVAQLASYLPARRAVRIDPLRTLRSE